MLITTLHETIFDYENPIQGTFTEARLWPVSDAHQTCHEFSLTVDPIRPMTESRDYFGNLVLTFNILPPHHQVVVTGHSVVETHRNPFVPNAVKSEFDLQKARFDFLRFDGPVENLPELKEVAKTVGLEQSAMSQAQTLGDMRQEQSLSGDLFGAVQALNSFIYKQFTYEATSTHVHTKISEVFAGGCGVCQDFAHIFIAVCRSVGLSARYVSGYLVTRRSRSAEGASASHAWAEVLLPGDGWYAFDPTNNLLANDYYIKLAVGRDYRDVSPTRGIYKGRGINSRLGVRVHTIVEDLGLIMDESRDTSEDINSENSNKELVG